MSTTIDVSVTIESTAHGRLSPVAELPVTGTLAFLPNGNLLVVERRWSEHCLVAHEFAPDAGGRWAEARAVTIKGVRGSPIGCAVSADGAFLAAGSKIARVYDRSTAQVVASPPAVRHQLERNSLGFSPSGARIAVADGGYVSPRNRTVTVCDAATGAKLTAIKTDEWSFQWAAMPDESTVLTLGLAFDWVSGDDETDGQRVLGCYDADTGAARWRRVLLGEQRPGLDRAAGRLWVADDESPYITKNLLALSLADGSVTRTVGFDDEWRADKAAPVVVGPATLMLPVKSYKRGGMTRTVVVDTEQGRVVAELGHEGDLSGEAFPPTAHVETRRVAATVEGATVVWQLP